MNIMILFPSLATKTKNGFGIKKVFTNFVSKSPMPQRNNVVFFYETKSCSVPVMDNVQMLVVNLIKVASGLVDRPYIIDNRRQYST
jgi:hypothetical protein